MLDQVPGRPYTQLFLAIFKIPVSCEIFIPQQDSAQAHRARETITLAACELLLQRLTDFKILS